MSKRNITTIIFLLLVFGATLAPNTMIASDKELQMHEAVLEGDLSKLKDLFKDTTKSPKIDWQESDDNNTVFHILLTIKQYKPIPQGEFAKKEVEKKYKEIITFLIDKAKQQRKENVFTLRNRDGDMPLHLALTENSLATGFILKTFLATLPSAVLNKVLCAENADKELPVQIAIENKSVNGLATLIAYPEIQKQFKQSLGGTGRNQNILHIAAYNNSHTIIRALLPQLSANQEDVPLDPVITGFFSDLKKMVNQVDDDGQTPLMCAAEEANYHAILELLKIPTIDVMKKNSQGRTAFEILYGFYAQAALESKKIISLENVLPFDINVLRFGTPGLLFAGGSLAATYASAKIVESFHENAPPEATNQKDTTKPYVPSGTQQVNSVDPVQVIMASILTYLPGVDKDNLRKGMAAVRNIKRDDRDRVSKGLQSHRSVKDHFVNLLAQESIQTVGRYTLTQQDFIDIMNRKNDPRFGAEYRSINIELDRILGLGLVPLLEKNEKMLTEPMSNGWTPFQAAVVLDDARLVCTLLDLVKDKPALLQKLLKTPYPFQSQILITGAGKIAMGIKGFPFKGFITQAMDVISGVDDILMSPEGLTPFQFAISKGLLVSLSMMGSGKMLAADYNKKFPNNYLLRYAGRTPLGALLADMEVFSLKYPQVRFLSIIYKAAILSPLISKPEVLVGHEDLSAVIRFLRNTRQSSLNLQQSENERLAIVHNKGEALMLGLLIKMLERVDTTGNLDHVLSKITDGKKNILHLAAQICGGVTDEKARDGYIEKDGKKVEGIEPQQKKFINYLISSASCDTWLRSRDEDGNLPLHVACGNQKITWVVNELLQKAPDTLTALNNNGDTPLHRAAQAQNDVILRYMLSEKPIQSTDALKIANKSGKKPLDSVSERSYCGQMIIGFQKNTSNKAIVENIRVALDQLPPPVTDDLKTQARFLTTYVTRLCMLNTGIILDDKGERVDKNARGFEHETRFLWGSTWHAWEALKNEVSRDYATQLAGLFGTISKVNVKTKLPLIKAYLNRLQNILNRPYKSNQEKINHYAAILTALEPLREVKWKECGLSGSGEYDTLKSLLTTTREFLSNQGADTVGVEYREGEESFVDSIRENYLKNKYFQGAALSVTTLALVAYAYAKRKSIKRFFGFYKQLAPEQENKLVQDLSSIISFHSKEKDKAKRKEKQKQYKKLEEALLFEYAPQTVKRIKKRISEQVRNERAQGLPLLNQVTQVQE